MKPFPITPGQFIALWCATVGVTFGTAALLRKAQGLPFFKPKLDGVALQQTWISGRSSRGLLGSWASVNNALWFMLTRDALHVGAHFPFNMFMPTFLARLDLEIPLRTVTSVVEKDALLGGRWVRVTYDVAEGAGPPSAAYVELRPRSGDRFLEKLRENIRAARA